MSIGVAKFTPSVATAEQLESIFVAREDLLAAIVGRIEQAATTENRNHTLLVGPRGSGKTHLVALAYHRARAMREGQRLRFCLSWLPEDPWAVSS